MIFSPRAKSVIDIVRIENQERIIEIDEVFLLQRVGLGNVYVKIPYWKRGVHDVTGYGGKPGTEPNSYHEWGDEIGEWGTELKKAEWGKLIPK